MEVELKSTMVPQITTPKIQNLASVLRHNQTEAEKMLWTYLRAHQLCGIHFRRQHVIGKYVVDFCAARKKLIVELDGSPHITRREADNERTAYLILRGYCILRFWNYEVTSNIAHVIQTIEIALRKR